MKIGVMLPIAESDGATPGYGEIRGIALQAEAAGFDSIWIIDHMLFRRDGAGGPTAGIWEAWTLMSALAEATDRVEIGSIVLCGPFRNPAILAKMADTLDEVSGGRAILGLGAGWHEPEFTAFGVPFDHLGSRFDESLQIITPLLREGKVDFTGTYYRAEQAELKPRGPRAGGPPILVAGGKPRMLRLTATYADAWNGAWYGTVEAMEAPLAALYAACDEVGRERDSIEITAGVSVRYPAAGSDPVDRRKALSGTPGEIAAELKRYADAGVGHVICGLTPNTEASVAEFAQALAAYRELAG